MAGKGSKKITTAKEEAPKEAAEKTADEKSGDSAAIKAGKSKIRVLKNALKKHPDDIQLNYLLGMQYMTQWELSPAIEAFLIALDPYLDFKPASLRNETEVLLPQIIFGLSNAFMATGDLEGAQDVCELGISIYPKYGDIFLKAGIVKQHQSDYEGATLLFKKAIKFQLPPFESYPFTHDLKMSALRGMATSYFYLDDLQNAEKYYIKALKEDPSDLSSIQGLAYSLRDRYETKVALKKIEKYADLENKELYAEVLRLLTDLPLQF